MAPRFNIYFDGSVAAGQDPRAVRERLARLFKADEATLDRLFSGRPQLIKRNCDEATARRFKQAMEKAGAIPTIATANTAPAAAAPERKPTAAERIAALAAAPDVGAAGKPATRAADPAVRDSEPGMVLAPEGTPVLREAERRTPEQREVDTSGLSAAASGERLSPERPAAPPPPDTAHMSLAGAGETIPNLPRHAAPVAPDTSALTLSPEGTDYSDCAGPPVAALDLDLSAIELAPEGADVLEPQYRRETAGEAPDTSHLSLRD